ncbi:MAG: hypothetical protein E7476_00315 [Ruminococcaceae bacterium]|nr:hypothetical protein [Oscillospiraceae bacterium]
MGKRILIDSDDLQQLVSMMELGEWSSALELARRMADTEFRSSIRAAQRRNYELYQLGQMSKFDYEENRKRLRKLSDSKLPL